MAERIADKNALANQLVWALLKYKDNSEFCFQTTLNPEILREYGVVLEPGKLVRLDKKYYWSGRYIYRQFSFADTVVSLWDGLHYTHEPSMRVHPFM